MESLGFDAKNQTIFQMISNLDKNKSGSIDFEEFKKRMFEEAEQERRKEIKCEKSSEQKKEKFSGKKGQTRSYGLKRQLMDKAADQ